MEAIAHLLPTKTVNMLEMNNFEMTGGQGVVSSSLATRTKKSTAF